ncbi:hypothetical protein BJX99DRAFT_193873 [Aspergillus californicus]
MYGITGSCSNQWAMPSTDGSSLPTLFQTSCQFGPVLVHPFHRSLDRPLLWLIVSLRFLVISMTVFALRIRNFILRLILGCCAVAADWASSGLVWACANVLLTKKE